MTEMPPLALLAGGLATRLRPITATIPKALVEVAGEPFIAHQLRLLAREKIRRVVLCTGYLGDQIEEFVGDGSRFGVEVVYSPDGPKLLGTGGALRRAQPLLGPEFLVMYGDSYLDVAFRPIVEAFRASGKSALMTVFHNEGRWDTSNVWFEDGAIRVYDKKRRLPEMRHIDWGLGLVTVGVLEPLTADVPVDLAEVYTALAEQNDLAGFEVSTRFYEIGSLEGLAEADAFLRGVPLS